MNELHAGHIKSLGGAEDQQNVCLDDDEFGNYVKTIHSALHAAVHVVDNAWSSISEAHEAGAVVRLESRLPLRGLWKEVGFHMVISSHLRGQRHSGETSSEQLAFEFNVPGLRSVRGPLFRFKTCKLMS